MRVVQGVLLDKTGSWTVVFGVATFHYVLGALVWMAWSGGDSILEEDRVS